MLISRAKTAGRLQRVLETHRGMPPIEHDRGVRQRLALQPPQTGIAVAQHRRRRVCRYAGHGERLLERVGRDRGGIACESKAGLAALSVDHLACNHLKVTLVLAVPAADIAAIKGSVRTHASKRLCCRTSDDVRLCRLQNGQHGHGSAEEERSAAAGGNVLVGAGAEAKKVAKFIMISWHRPRYCPCRRLLPIVARPAACNRTAP